MRILLPRLDTHGDIILLEGFLEALLARYQDSTVTLLVRPGYDQLAPLFPSSLRWHAIAVRPYQPVRSDDGQLERVEAYLSAHRYDLVLGTCFSQTWADTAIGALVNAGAHRVALCGPGGPPAPPEPVRTFVRSRRGGRERPAWDQTVAVDQDCDEGTKYQVLWEALPAPLSQTSPIPLPRLRVPPALDAEARAILQQAGLPSGSYVCCCPAGTANITIKTWPRDRFAEMIAWLEREHRLPTLVAGHSSERPVLASVHALARARGARPGLWIGNDGQLPLLAALTSRARLYLGNDSGPMHLATALQVPAVAVFGGGHWPRFVPRQNAVALVRELLCFGCGWNCLFGDALCVKLIRTEDVRRAVESVVGEFARPDQGDGRQEMSRPTRIVRLDTPLEVEPLDAWIKKAEAQRAQPRAPAPPAGLLAAVARRLRVLREV